MDELSEAELATDGWVSKRRWLSLSRPSEHRAGRPAGFPEGRDAEAPGRLVEPVLRGQISSGQMVRRVAKPGFRFQLDDEGKCRRC